MPDPCITTRRDGWTAPRRQLFLTQLERTGRIALAAAAAGPSASSVYRLCRRDPAFEAACRDAVAARWQARFDATRAICETPYAR